MQEKRTGMNGRTTMNKKSAEERLNRLMAMTAEAVRKREAGLCKAHFSYETNTKLGRIAGFSVMPGYTCTMAACAHCGVEGCYAIKNVIRFGYNEEKSSVMHAWMENTILAVKDLKKLQQEIELYLSQYDGHFFRVHPGGDFVTEEYARMWLDVAQEFPEIQFLAFTKQWDIVRAIPFEEVSNFHLVPSGWTGCQVPEDIAERFHASHCVEKGAQPPEGALECPGGCETCNACWMLNELGKDVWFRKH